MILSYPHPAVTLGHSVATVSQTLLLCVRVPHLCLESSSSLSPRFRWSLTGGREALSGAPVSPELVSPESEGTECVGRKRGIE